MAVKVQRSKDIISKVNLTSGPRVHVQENEKALSSQDELHNSEGTSLKDDRCASAVTPKSVPTSAELPSNSGKVTSHPNDLHAKSRDVTKSANWWHSSYQSWKNSVKQMWRQLSLRTFLRRFFSQGQHPPQDPNADRTNEVMTSLLRQSDQSDPPAANVCGVDNDSEVHDSKSEPTISDESTDWNRVSVYTGSSVEPNQETNATFAGLGEAESCATDEWGSYQSISAETMHTTEGLVPHFDSSDPDAIGSCRASGKHTTAFGAGAEAEILAENIPNSNEHKHRHHSAHSMTSIQQDGFVTAHVLSSALQTLPSPYHSSTLSNQPPAWVIPSSAEKENGLLSTAAKKQTAVAQPEQKITSRGDHHLSSNAFDRRFIEGLFEAWVPVRIWLIDETVQVLARRRFGQLSTCVVSCTWHIILDLSSIPHHFVRWASEALTSDGGWRRLSPAQLELLFVPARLADSGHAEWHIVRAENGRRVMTHVNWDEECLLDLVLRIEYGLVRQHIGRIVVRNAPLLPRALLPHAGFWEDVTPHDQEIEGAVLLSGSSCVRVEASRPTLSTEIASRHRKTGVRPPAST